MKKKKSSIIITIFLVLILLAGLSLLLYPTFSDWWNSFHQTRAAQSYNDAVETLEDETKEKMLEEARAFNEIIRQKGNMSVLSDSELELYNKTLDVTGTGIMGTIDIPSINVSLPVYHGTSEGVLQVAIGHLEGSSLPVGGEDTHAVVSGHRGLPSAKLFTNLDRLVEGDLFTVTVLGTKLTYLVDQIRIVLPQEVDNLEIEAGKDYITLVTCTPYGINTHRLLVRGHRVATEDRPEVVVTADATAIRPILVALGIAAPILTVLMMVVLVKPRRRTHDEITSEKGRE